jgi:hypothetical protein
MKVAKICLFIIVLLTSKNALAVCRCVCINNKNVQMCDSQFDIKAFCALQRC